MTDGTETFGADEGLDELDRHARAATSALRAQIEDLVDDGEEIDWSAATKHASSLSAPPTDESAPDERNPHVIPLGRVRARRGGSTRRRRTLAGAAAVAALAVAGGALAIVGDGERPDVTSGAPAGALLPSWLPDGLEPTMAWRLDPTELTDAPTGEIAVYGDREATDPWAATLAVTHVVTPEDVALDWQPDEGETVTVAGHDATLSEITPVRFGSRGPGWQVQWPVEDGLLGVAGTKTTLGEVLMAADGIIDDADGSGIAPDGLPEGFTELARGPLDAATSPSLGDFPPAGLRIIYDTRTDDDEMTTIDLIQRPAPASAVDLLREAYVDSEAITVRGTHGVLSRHDDTGVTVQWAEADGQLVTVVASGVTEATVLQVVERLRPADPGQIEALLAEHAPPAWGELADLSAGQVEVASGAIADHGRWRVVADPAAGESMDALIVEITSTRGYSSSGAASGGSNGATPALDLTTGSAGDGTVVYGVVAADAATVTVEAPGRQPVPLELHTVDGWNHRVVASLIPHAGHEAVAIARSADGREVARTAVYGAGHIPFLPDAFGPGASEVLDAVVEETCETALDGTVVCSSVGTEATETIEAPQAIEAG